MKNEEQTLYDILGISRGANDAEIKSAYRKQVKISHPDQNVEMSEEQTSEQEEAFQKVKDAYDILKNPETKKAYDSTLPPYVEEISFPEEDWHLENNISEQATDIFQERINAMRNQRTNGNTTQTRNPARTATATQGDPYIDLSGMMNEIFQSFFQKENPLKKELNGINIKITDIEEKIKGIEFRVTSNTRDIDFIKKHIQEGIDKKRKEGTRCGNYPFIQKDCVEIENKLKKKFCFFRKKKQKELNRLKEQLHEMELKTEQNIQQYEERENARITFKEQQIHTNKMQLKNLKENLIILQRRKADIESKLYGYKKEETNYKSANMGK